jgi:hypothetical protein
MGAWAGIGIWLSPESMPFTLMAFGGLWLAWTLQPRPDLVAMIAQVAIGFLLVVAGAFAVDPPYAGYAAVEIDRISLVYLALGGVVAAMAGAAAMVERPPSFAAIALGYRLRGSDGGIGSVATGEIGAGQPSALAHLRSALARGLRRSPPYCAAPLG